MFGTLDFLREIGHKLKGGGLGGGGNANGAAGFNDDGRGCRAVILQLPRSQPIDIEFKDISYIVNVKNEKKAVLKEVSGKFKSGELTAIMGPSGAGKTSLLNILTGFQTTGATGTISNQKCGRRMSNQYKKESCYILQDDQLCPLFSVIEMMNMAADLKLGNNLSIIAKQMVIDEVLETLGLTATKETRCSRLSGGQKKRLSIALELIDNPPIMFLDEPTTGLDSSSTLQCISMLKELSRGGRTIVCTIHQPSATVYEMFDHVYMLAEGMCVYQGATTNTVDYLKTYGLECPKYHNPADYFLEIANCEYGNFNSQLADGAVSDCWRNDNRVIENENNITTISKSHRTPRGSLMESCKATILITPPSELTKFWVLFNRCSIQMYRDWTVTHLKAFMHCLVGIILGLCFTGSGSDGSKSISNVGFLLIGIVYLTYTSMMPAILRFPQELLILKKENFNNWYKLRTFYAAVIICNTPIQILFAAIYSGSSYFLSAQPLETSRFMMFLIILMLVTLISEAYGHIIGTLVDAVNGTFCGAILTCTMLVFGGFLVLFPHMSRFMYIVSYASTCRYALEGLMLAIYGNNRQPLICPEDVTYCHLRNPTKLLEEVSMKHVNYWQNVGILIGMLVLLKIIAFYSLRRNLRRS